MIEVTMSQMLEAGVHFGHQTRYWNPKMAPFIYGARHKIHIINLEETLPRYRSALKYLGNIAGNKGKILFVGTKHAARDVVKEEAIRCGMPYVNFRWLAGLLTNYKTIRLSIRRLKELEELLQDEKQTSRFTKKEILRLLNEKEKLSHSIEGVKNMGGLPDALFVVDVGHEKIAIKEAKKLSIPVIGIVDTNNNPADVDYPVPGNDDALRAIRFYCKNLADTLIEARGVLNLTPVETEETPAVKATVKVKKVIKKKVEADENEPEPIVEAAKSEQKKTQEKAPPAKKKSAKVEPEDKAAAKKTAPRRSSKKE